MRRGFAMHGMPSRGWPAFGRFPFEGRPFGRGPRARRGDVRAAALALIAEEPRNGYQIIQEIKKRSGGLWRPSSGSVYPALQQLEDEGLIRSDERDGRRAFHLTEAGQTYVQEHEDELASPWAAVADGVSEGSLGLHDLLGQVSAAAMQFHFTASEEQIAEARRVLAEARRSLYRILAEGDGDEADGEDLQV